MSGPFENRLSGAQLKESAARYKSTVQRLRNREAQNGFRWDVLNSGIGETNTFDYFNDKSPQNEGNNFKVVFPEGLEGVRDEVKAWHDKGKKVLIIDFMGQGEGCLATGADDVLASHWGEPSSDERVRTIGGDALSQEKKVEFISVLDAYIQKGYVISHVFFRPFGGANRYMFNAYARKEAYTLLRDTVSRMPKGGRVFMQHTLGSEFLEHIAGAFKFRNSIHTERDAHNGRGISNSVSVFTKPSEHFTMPSVRQIISLSRKQPGIGYMLSSLELGDAIDKGAQNNF